MKRGIDDVRTAAMCFVCAHALVGVLIDWTGRPLCPHLGVEARVLTHITDVDGESRGGHQLSDAVIDQPIGTR